MVTEIEYKMKIDIEKLTLELTKQGWHALALRLEDPEFRNEKYQNLPLTDIDKMVEYLNEHMWDDKEIVKQMVESCCDE